MLQDKKTAAACVQSSAPGDKKTRMIVDLGLTYIIKTFKAIRLHVRAKNGLSIGSQQIENLYEISRIIAARDKARAVHIKV